MEFEIKCFIFGRSYSQSNFGMVVSVFSNPLMLKKYWEKIETKHM